MTTSNHKDYRGNTNTPNPRKCKRRLILDKITERANLLSNDFSHKQVKASRKRHSPARDNRLEAINTGESLADQVSSDTEN
jgi:hypothetical protein